jgi:HD superfamily phosphodiesterase
MLNGISESASAILAEHGGMVEELLSGYEQLGIVFEVTRRLPDARHEHEVIELFLDSLKRTFAGSEVSVGVRDEARGWLLGRDGAAAGDWLAELLERCRQNKSVLVEPPVGEARLDEFSEIMVGPLFCGDAFVCSIVLQRRPETRAYRACDMLMVESLTTFCGDLLRNHRLVRELREASVAMVRSLVSAVDQKDQYTSGHSLRVGYFASLLGAAVNLKSEQLQMLQWSALLHDVGKIGIRDDVLKKKGKLTAEEFDHIKEHPVRSYHVVKDVPQLTKAIEGALHHHEHYDGSGYPDGLAGEDIPLQARIIQIADIFDALTSTRSYRKAYDWQKALDILEKEAGKIGDPNLQKVFDRLIRDTLGDDPDGWNNLVAQAEQFALSPADLDSWAPGD